MRRATGCGLAKSCLGASDLLPCIAQLLSNLVANALTYGAAEQPSSVTASGAGTQLELSVTNQGTPIPPHVAKQLFEPFFRASSGHQHKGLGLGLYIAWEIARAHGAR